jgi:hypothetical protein
MTTSLPHTGALMAKPYRTCVGYSDATGCPETRDARV